MAAAANANDGETHADREFWTGYQPGFRGSSPTPGCAELFAETDRTRYVAESHVPDVVTVYCRWSLNYHLTVCLCGGSSSARSSFPAAEARRAHDGRT